MCDSALNEEYNTTQRSSAKHSLTGSMVNIDPPNCLSNLINIPSIVSSILNIVKHLLHV